MKSNKQQNSKRGASRQGQKVEPTLAINPQPIILLAVLLLFSIACYYAFLWLQRSVDVPVESVSITGSFNYVDRKKIAEKIEPFTRSSYLSVDLEAIKTELEKNPWVYQSSVKRQWPDQISVFIVEQEPLAQWSSDSFINSDGELFTPERMLSINSIPYLEGPTGSLEEVLQDFSTVSDVLVEHNLSVSEWKMDRKGAKSLSLNNGIELVLGVGDMELKLDRFLMIYQRQLLKRSNEISRVDMRYTNGLAVKWRPAADKVAQH